MKLIVNAGPVSPIEFTVVNGDDVVATYSAYGPEVEKTIDRIFSERYIEAVQFVPKTVYSVKFEDYIEEKYANIEIL